MMALLVKAVDFADLHELLRTALGTGMYYRKPRTAGTNITPAEGVLLTAHAGLLAACGMATSRRTIIHARIPCTIVQGGRGGLFALETPPYLHRALRRFGRQQITLQFEKGRLGILLPRPNNVKGMISVPMRRAMGRMLSAVSPEPATPVSLDGPELSRALRRIPRRPDGALLAIVPSATGVEVRTEGDETTTCEHLRCSTLEGVDEGSSFVCSAQRSPYIERIIRCLQKRDPMMRAKISASRFAIWNGWATAQVFSDLDSDDATRLLAPATVVESRAVVLALHTCAAHLPKGYGKWVRQLAKKELANRGTPTTTWHLSPNRIVLDLNCGLQTSTEWLCESVSWPLEEQQIHLGVDPLVTAEILDLLESVNAPTRLVFQDAQMTFESGTRRFQLTGYAAVTRTGTSDSEHVQAASSTAGHQ